MELNEDFISLMTGGAYKQAPKKKTPANDILGPVLKSAAPVAKPIGGDVRKNTSGGQRTVYEKVNPSIIDADQFRDTRDVANEASDIQSLIGSEDALQDLIKRREEYTPNVMPSALMSAATEFLSQGGIGEGVGKSLQGLVNSKEENNLTKIQDQIDAYKQKASMAQARGALSAKGIDQQIFEPQLKPTQVTEYQNMSGSGVGKGAGKPVDYEKYIKQYMKETAEAGSALKNLNDLAPYLGKKEIPGIGTGKSMLPDFALSSEGVDVQQKVRELAMIRTKLRSGSQASDRERDAYMRQIGLGVKSNAESFKKGIPRLIRDIKAELKQKELIPKEALDLIRERGGVTSKDFDELEKSIKPSNGALSNDQINSMSKEELLKYLGE